MSFLKMRRVAEFSQVSRNFDTQSLIYGIAVTAGAATTVLASRKDGFLGAAAIIGGAFLTKHFFDRTCEMYQGARLYDTLAYQAQRAPLCDGLN